MSSSTRGDNTDSRRTTELCCCVQLFFSRRIKKKENLARMAKSRPGLFVHVCPVEFFSFFFPTNFVIVTVKKFSNSR